MDGSEIDERLATGSLAIILFRELPIAAKPSQRSLDHPVFWNDGEALLSSQFLNDFDRQIGLALGPLKQSAFVPLISTNRLQARKAVMVLAQEPVRTFALGNVGRMYQYSQQQAVRINQNMSFSAFDFFPPSNPRSPPASVDLTLWLSITALLGSLSRPSCTRTA